MKVIERIALSSLFIGLVSMPTGCELPPVKIIQQTDGRNGPTNRATNPSDLDKNAPGDGSSTSPDSPSSPDASPHWIQIKSTIDTYFKTERVDSSELDRSQKCLLPKGTRHNLAQSPEWVGSYVKVTLKKPMVGCDFTSGWVFAPHIDSSSDSSLGPILSSHKSKATLYTTENTAMEGGPKDRCGRPLHTLIDYLNGDADHVSVAMDSKALPYGTLLRIPEIEKKFNFSEAIPFKVVDTGSAFYGQGLSRMDICVGHNQQTIYSADFIWISNKTFDVQVIKKGNSFDCD